MSKHPGSRGYSAEEMAQYWAGYHTARLRYDEGGAAFCRVMLEDVRGGKPARYVKGWETYMAKQEREHEYSERALLERM